MLLHVSENSSLFGPMSLDPTLIREKLFQGIDRDYNVTNMGIVVEVIRELENFHITKEALEATRLGKHINELRRKSSDKLLANRAKSLVKKWRSLFSAGGGGETTGPPPGGGGNNNSLAAANGNTTRVAGHPAAVVVSPSIRTSPLSPGLPAQRGVPAVNISGGPPLVRSSAVSPGLPPLRSSTAISPGLPPLRSSSAISPGLPRPHSNHSSSSTISPGLSPISSSSAAVRTVAMAAAAVAAAASTGGGGLRSARPSPSVSRSVTPRVSPATVILSSSGSSPSNSRPSSPAAAAAFRPLNAASLSLGGGETTSLPNSRSPSPEIEIIEEVVNTPRLVINNKRLRRDDSDVRVVDVAAAAKRPRLDFQHQTLQNHTTAGAFVNGSGGNGASSLGVAASGKDGKTRDGVISRSDSSSKKAGIVPRNAGGGGAAVNSSSPKPKSGHPMAASHNHKQPQQQQHSMLNKQISLAQRSGKVKTTRELVENLGIEPSAAAASRQSSLSPPTMTSLVPSENKEELMKRFFESQQHRGDRASPSVTDLPSSRPNSATAAAASGGGAVLTSSSATVSQASSRAPTPQLLAPSASVGGTAATAVEDILAQLPPIDPAAVLAEWAAQMEAEEEIDGLIPVFRPPRLEVTDQVVAALNGEGGGDEERLEHVGGITDHAGVFREWHEMVAKARGVGEQADEELLHILPYTLIE